MRAKSAEAVRLLNFTELKHLVLSSNTYNFEDRRVFFGKQVELKNRPLKGICPWFSEISMVILQSSFYLHSIDITLFKCQDSLLAMETLADNASYLKAVKLRNPKEYTVFPDLATKDRGHEFYSLTKMLDRLLNKSAVETLHLIDFHSNPIYRVWWTPALMTSVKERLKAELVSSQPSASSSTASSKETSAPEPETEEKAKLQVLVSALSEEQLDRYEAFRRSKFPQSMMRKMVHGMTGVMPSSNCCIALSGIAKVLVGQIVEESLEVQDSLKETGPIHPKHIRDAVRRLRNQGKLGISHHRKNKLKRL
ncbi:hypothetical protein ACHWQZ_G007838 [Mnemiopsis leidyi]